VIEKFFLNICWTLNLIGLAGFVASVRWALHKSCMRWVQYQKYEQPRAIGYHGCVVLPYIGVLAFDRIIDPESGDEPFQYRW
jgi:hypothetical protein